MRINLLSIVVEKIFHAIQASFQETSIQVILSIVIFTLCLRIAFLPLKTRAFISKRKRTLLKDTFKDLNKKRRADSTARKEIKNKIKHLHSIHNITPLRNILFFTIIQVVISVHFITILYKLSDTSSGLWFELDKPDHLYVLPILFFILFLFECYPQRFYRRKSDYIIYIILSLMMAFVSQLMIAAVIVYLITSSLYNIIVNVCLERYCQKNVERNISI